MVTEGGSLWLCSLCRILYLIEAENFVVYAYQMQLLNVYLPKYETGGKFWPIVHNSTIFSLVLMQVIAIGIFGLKKLPLASVLILPLPLVTLLFNEYCRKRFLPLFHAYPAEVIFQIYYPFLFQLCMYLFWREKIGGIFMSLWGLWLMPNLSLFASTWRGGGYSNFFLRNLYT